jgi:phage repressor protein C with HTH and peptisase S24 domain
MLIDALHKFEVSEDLVLSILEAAEANVDVEALYPTARGEAPAESDDSSAEPSEPRPGVTEGVARPMGVYRLASNARLYFSEANLPVGPPSELIYISRLKSPEACFAVELGTDSMTNSGTPTFKTGSILIFSTAARVENGDFAYIRGRMSDEFAQVFLEKNDEVRIRPLNPRHHEHTLRRNEVRAMCKLVGCYEDLSG